MATSFAPAPQAILSPASQYSHHHTFSHGSQHTPPNNTPPSTNISPTNKHLHVRQLRQPTQCFYIPAAFRPTETRPRRPLTPPRSAHSSVDSRNSNAGFAATKSLPVSPTEDMGAYFAQFGGVTRVVTDEWTDDLPNVTGQPTRNHWKVRLLISLSHPCRDLCLLSVCHLLRFV